RIIGDRIKKFGPLGCKAGIGHVAADEHEVHRIGRVDAGKARQSATQAISAARPAATTFDPKAVSFADHVKIGKMCNPKAAARGSRNIEDRKVERLGHGGGRTAPEEG